ncbi:hypothetical protein FRC12_002682 [Ceratobasidium sp. 428]|nr:hypothetical protein FRC12_002682 [Ceratobasidium sp. 428]
MDRYSAGLAKTGCPLFLTTLLKYKYRHLPGNYCNENGPPSPTAMKLTALVLAAVASVSMAAAVPCTLGQMEAEQKFLKAGIHASSSGHCTEWTNPKCTSYSGIRCVTADNLIV